MPRVVYKGEGPMGIEVHGVFRRSEMSAAELPQSSWQELPKSFERLSSGDFENSSSTELLPVKCRALQEQLVSSGSWGSHLLGLSTELPAR